MKALEKNPTAICFVRSPTPLIYSMVIDRNPHLIAQIKEPPEWLCWKAIRQKAETLIQIQHPNHRLCLEAIKTQPQLINYLQKTGVKKIPFEWKLVEHLEGKCSYQGQRIDATLGRNRSLPSIYEIESLV